MMSVEFLITLKCPLCFLLEWEVRKEQYIKANDLKYFRNTTCINTGAVVIVSVVSASRKVETKHSKKTLNGVGPKVHGKTKR